MAARSYPRRAVTVGLIALAARLLYVLAAGRNAGIVVGNDALSYDTFARLMMSGWSWVTTPLAIREPLYPAFMVFAYVVPGGEIGALQVLQALLGAAGVVAVYLTLRTLASEPVALLSAALIAFNPHFVAWTPEPLRENLLIPLLIGFLMTFLLAVTGRRVAWLFFSALLFVLVVHTDVRFLLLAAMFPFMAFAYHRDVKLAIRQTLWLGLFTALLMIPYQVRGYVALGKPVIVTERFLGKWLARSTAVMTDAEDDSKESKRQAWLHEWEAKKLASIDEISPEERAFFQSGVRPETARLRVHWILFVEYWRFARFQPMYRPYPDGRFEPPWSLRHNLASSAVVVPFLILLPVVFTRRFRKWRPIAGPMLLFLLGSTLLHVLVHARERYRIPLEVVMAIVVAMAIVTLWSSARRSHA